MTVFDSPARRNKRGRVLPVSSDQLFAFMDGGVEWQMFPATQRIAICERLHRPGLRNGMAGRDNLFTHHRWISGNARVWRGHYQAVYPRDLKRAPDERQQPLVVEAARKSWSIAETSPRKCKPVIVVNPSDTACRQNQFNTLTEHTVHSASDDRRHSAQMGRV